MMNKSEAYKIVFEDLTKCDMFKGIYDAEHGKDSFMYGVLTVMENIAFNVSEECGDKFSTKFTENMNKSHEKAVLNLLKKRKSKEHESEERDGEFS